VLFSLGPRGIRALWRSVDPWLVLVLRAWPADERRHASQRAAILPPPSGRHPRTEESGDTPPVSSVVSACAR
jgi:hypothetical protein